MNSAIRCEQRDDGSIEIFVNDVVRGRYAGLNELAMHLGFCIAARDAIGYGTPIDLNDKHGNPVHIGDMLAFDQDEWGGKFEPYVVTIEKGEIQLYGAPSDIPQFCEIVKRWDQTG